jgi:hypothetical protein
MWEICENIVHILLPLFKHFAWSSAQDTRADEIAHMTRVKEYFVFINTNYSLLFPSLFQESIMSILATDPEARVRFPALPEKSSESGTGSTQPREYNWGATW